MRLLFVALLGLFLPYLTGCSEGIASGKPSSISALPNPTYTGKIIGITDGDTLTLLTAENVQIKVRLAEIDTPEKRQPYGQRARQSLSDLAFGKQARVKVQAVDRYGHSVSKIYVGNVDVNREMVRQGAA
jgi:endonuclease YncB( thermonuclease family)